MEIDIYRIAVRPEIRWEYDVKEAARVMKIAGQNASRIGLNGGKYWRRPKLWNNEVVAAVEDEEGIFG